MYERAGKQYNGREGQSADHKSALIPAEHNTTHTKKNLHFKYIIESNVLV